MKFVLEEREEGFGIFEISIGPREMGMGRISPRNLECAFRVGNLADDTRPFNELRVWPAVETHRKARSATSGERR